MIEEQKYSGGRGGDPSYIVNIHVWVSDTFAGNGNLLPHPKMVKS
jgi:hypothetical protein